MFRTIHHLVLVQVPKVVNQTKSLYMQTQVHTQILVKVSNEERCNFPADYCVNYRVFSDGVHDIWESLM